MHRRDERRAGRAGRRAAGAAGLALALLVAACSGGGLSQAQRSDGSRTTQPGTAAGNGASPSGTLAAGALSLQVTPAPYQLPSGLAREVILPAGRDLLIAGGLTPRATSTRAVRLLNPTTGGTTRVSRLSVPTHEHRISAARQLHRLGHPMREPLPRQNLRSSAQRYG